MVKNLDEILKIIKTPFATLNNSEPIEEDYIISY